MDFSAICRTCLSSEGLNPIFRLNNDIDTYSNAIYLATGVKVQYKDNLPQNMCRVCINKLTDILKFRLQCKDVETRLINFITEEKSSFIDTIQSENTNSTNERREFNNSIKNESDLEDDKPLKLLIKNEVFEIQENIDSVTDYPYETKSVNSNNELEKSENLKKATFKKHKPKENYIPDLRDTKGSPTILNISETQDIDSYNNDPTESPNLLDMSGPPYELITDPVTMKVTRVTCKLCNKELSVRSIDSHVSKRHPGADERKVKCELCDSYIMKEKLNRHLSMKHGNGSFNCAYCKSEFNSKDGLMSHVDTCSAKKRKRKVNDSGRELRECDICHQVMQKASLRMHKAVKHAGLKPVCEHCGKTFGNKFRLNEHYRAKHGYEKFQCKYCEFRSAGAMAMRNHERRHRNEKPYVCETCGAKFHAAYLLAQHKHSHRTEKLVKCDLCPSVFKANNSLHMHKLTCHSSSMYRCAICYRSYKCRHYAVKHVRHVHRYSGPDPPLAVVNNETTVEINEA